MADLDDELLALAESDDESNLASPQEDGEASAPGSPASMGSQGSGAMDESDSDKDADADADDEPDLLDEDNPFPVEGVFKSERDRARIMALPEIQREAELAERAADQTRRQQEIALRKMVQEHQAASDAKKRKAAAADLENDDARKSSRPKIRVTNEKLDNYKKDRENRNKEQARRQQERARGRKSVSPQARRSASEEDRDAEGESDDFDFEFSSKSKSKAKDDPPAELQDFNACRIGRSGFTEVMFYPGFPEAITGCFVRLLVGQRKEDGKTMYRMLEIKGIEERPGEQYKMELNGKFYVTDQYVIAAMGKEKKPLKFDFCSNDRFTEAELNYFKVMQDNAGYRMPTKTQIQKRHHNMMALRNIKWDPEKIAHKLSKQEKYGSEAASYAVRRAEAAKAENTTEALSARLEARNKENRRRNQVEGRQQLLQERAARQEKARQAAGARRKREAEEAEKKAKEEEKKRKAAARLEVKRNGDLFGDSDAASTPGISRTGTPVPAKYDMKSLPTFTRKKMDDEIIGEIDIDIDIDI